MGIRSNFSHKTSSCLLLHPPRRPSRPALAPPARPSSSPLLPTTRSMLPRLPSRSVWPSSVELSRELSRWPEPLVRELDPTSFSRLSSQRRSRRQRSLRPRRSRRSRRSRRQRSLLPRRPRSQRRLPRRLPRSQLPRSQLPRSLLPRSLRPRRPPRSQPPRRPHPRSKSYFFPDGNKKQNRPFLGPTKYSNLRLYWQTIN